MRADQGAPTPKPASKKLRLRRAYQAQPVAARKSQVQSKGVLAPAYAKQVKVVHQQRQQQAAREVAAATRKIAVKTEQTVGRGNTAVKHPKKGGSLLGVVSPTAAISAASHLAEAPLAAAPVLAVVHHFTGVKPPSAAKIIKNAPTDAAELAVTTPSSLYHLGDQAVHGKFKDIGHELAQPYKELAKHPGQFIESHPVSTYLMVKPGLAVPDRAAGAALRLAGKQTLERTPSTLPGTPLTDLRTDRFGRQVKGSRSASINAIQKLRDARHDAKHGRPVMTDKQIQKRVDLLYEASKQDALRHREAVQQAAERAIVERKMTPAAAAEHRKGAMIGASKQIKVRRRQALAKEMGSTWYRDPSGAIIKPKNATEGRLYDARGEAEAIQKKLGTDQFAVQAVGKQFSVVPRVAVRRLEKQEVVGTSKATGAVVFRESRKAFGRSVLPFSPKFLPGQVAEGGVVRPIVTGTGPTSYMRAGKVLKAMTPEARQALIDKTIKTPKRTGHSGLAQEYGGRDHTLADAFEETGLETPAKALTKAGAAPGVRHVRSGFHAWSNLVFQHVNGTIEHHAQKAMLGKAIKQSPLMERSVLGLTDKAIQNAAKGLEDPALQAQVARELHHMYGKYTAFSPAIRETIMHSTPFLPWYLNVARFILHTLPVEHPVHAALVADVDAATEDWRKQHGLSLRGPGRKPDFLLGQSPKGAPVGRFTPFAPADVAGSVGGLVLPQFVPAVGNLAFGVDWKGQQLKGHRVPVAAVTELESLVPAVAQLDRLSGLGGRFVSKTGEPAVGAGKSGKQVLKDAEHMFNPVSKPKHKMKKTSTLSGFGGSSKSSAGGGFGGRSSKGAGGGFG